MAKGKLDLSTNTVVECAFYAIIGLLLVILQSGSLGILMSIVGIMFMVVGVVEMMQNKDMIKGGVQLALGIIIIVCGWLIADIVLLVFGILLIIKGALDLKDNIKGGFSNMLPAIITIIVGVLLVVAKWALIDVFCIIAGVVFIINAVLILFGKSPIKK